MRTWKVVRGSLAVALAFVFACDGTSCRARKSPRERVIASPVPVPVATADVLVHFDSAAASDRPLLLYSGMRANTCQRFEPHVGTGTPLITLLALSWDWNCAVEIVVFVRGHGAFGRAVDRDIAQDVEWMTNAISSGGLFLAYPALVRMPVRMWLAAAPGDLMTATDLQNRQVTNAVSLFEELATGITVEWSSVVLTPTAVSPFCTQADAISANSAIYDATKINVYYVKNYQNQEFSSYAVNCWMEGHAEIIFVSWGNANTPDVVLAHELGHALGLVHPQTASIPQIGGGHTNNVSAFSAHSDNLMYSGGGAITNISVGQLYAMNFGEDSWLNRVGSPFTRTVVHACQDNWDSGICPALTMFHPGWPP